MHFGMSSRARKRIIEMMVSISLDLISYNLFIISFAVVAGGLAAAVDSTNLHPSEVRRTGLLMLIGLRA